VIFAEYAVDCAHAAHEAGLKAVAVSAGYITEQARARFFAPMDAANIDLKGFTEHFYEKLCFAHLGPVLDTLRFLKHETQVWLELTTLLIPGQNDSEQEVAQLCEWVMENLGPLTPLHFTAFHPDFKLLEIPGTPPSTLTRARQRALATGLRHVYTGNIHDPDGQSTYCVGCGARIIERSGYRIGAYGLDGEAHCMKCGARAVGHFDARPGQFVTSTGPQRRRLPLHERT
jgi:pyruvate formate lyase activating enzyme